MSQSRTPIEVPVRMTAVVQHRFGGAEALEVAEIDTPTPGKGEVLVAVEAAGVDRGVWHLVRGVPRLVRLAGIRPKPKTIGFDLAGTVVGVGPDVTKFEVGDEVFGIGKGSYAAYAAADVKKLVRKSAGVSWDAAGGATISGITAHEAVRDVGGLVGGQRMLVLGASGGVGSFAVQIGAGLGATVVGVASAAKADFVESLGTTECLDYASGSLVELTSGMDPFDVILDCGGLNSLRDQRSLLTKSGTLVMVGGEGGGAITGGFGRGIRAGLLSPFVSHSMPFFLSTEKADVIASFGETINNGSVTTAISHTYDLTDAATALADLEAGLFEGKAVLRLS